MFSFTGSLLDFLVELPFFIVVTTAVGAAFIAIAGLLFLAVNGLWDMLTKAIKTAYSRLSGDR